MSKLSVSLLSILREFASRLETIRLTAEGEAIIMQVTTFVEFKKRLEEVFSPSASAVILFEAGKACGREFCIRVQGLYRPINEIDLLIWIAKFMKAGNWGEATFKALGSGSSHWGDIIIKGSFEAKRYGKVQTPICHFLRGFLSGVLSVVKGREVILIETKCIAKGDEWCDFQIKKESHRIFIMQ